MMRRLALLPALVLLAGCPSFSTMGTARTLPKGKGQFFVAPGGMVLKDFQRDSNGQYESFGLPTVEFGGRYGVTDGVEVGDLAWGQLTPVHWHLGTEQLSLADPDALMLDEAASRAFLKSIRLGPRACSSLSLMYTSTRRHCSGRADPPDAPLSLTPL